MKKSTVPTLKSQAARIAQLEKLLSLSFNSATSAIHKHLRQADAVIANALSPHSMSLLHMFAIESALQDGNAPGEFYVTETLDALELPEGIESFQRTLARASEMMLRDEELPTYDPTLYGAGLHQ